MYFHSHKVIFKMSGKCVEAKIYMTSPRLNITSVLKFKTNII